MNKITYSIIFMKDKLPYGWSYSTSPSTSPSTTDYTTENRKENMTYFYWFALILLIIRVVILGYTWLDSGIDYVFGHFIAELLILIAYIKLFKGVSK